MNLTRLCVCPYDPLRIGLLAFTSTGALQVAAQTSSVRYQHCEVQELGQNAAHRMESNYRYPPAASTRSLQGLPFYRCEAAWEQSPAVFNALGTCPYEITGCSADASGSCNDSPDDWTDYDFLGGKLWSDGFTRETAWSQNPQIKVHSSPREIEQWTRHRYWGWAWPARYAYQGIVERPSVPANTPYPKCYGMANMVGFFNGVWNARKDAEQGLDAFKAKDFVGDNRSSAPLKYHLFYNQTGCSRSKVACIEDVAEVFIQRSAELDGLLERRWEYFWEQINGRAEKSDSFTNTLLSRVLNAGNALGLWFNSLATASLGKITSLMAQMVASPPTAADTASHVTELIKQGQQGYRSVLVAHSQGNLFVNAAYEGYLKHAREAGASAGQDTGYVAAKVVHIAPASAVFNGPVVLAEIDVVIEGVRRVDSTPVAVNTLSAEVMPRTSADLSGHRLVETYLDPQRPARGVIKQLIVDSLDAL